MQRRTIADGVEWVGAIDWDRRLFDSLIPIPHGTTYNAYLVKGSQRTALLDTVDTTCVSVLLEHLKDVPKIDVVVAHHAEQDHSGALPFVLERYPDAEVVATAKGRDLLADHLGLPPERIRAVADDETLDLGGRALRFVHAPWQHWPETMMTFDDQSRILFSCDLFGSHLASADLFADPEKIVGPVQDYYAELMMPFAKVIRKNLDRVANLAPTMIAPSHGPVHHRPASVMAAYDRWVSGPPRNHVVVPYVTMHGSTREMVERFLCALTELGVSHDSHDLAKIDIGSLASAFVEPATVIFATPTVLGGPHPLAVTAAYLANALKPRLKLAGVIGSYGWGGNTANDIAGLLSGLRVEMLPPVMTKGHPRSEDLLAVERLAQTIATKHASLSLAA